jgi:hypothetical protein
MKVNGKDDIPYMKWKIKAMFETTNQFRYGHSKSSNHINTSNHSVLQKLFQQVIPSGTQTWQ